MSQDTSLAPVNSPIHDMQSQLDQTLSIIMGGGAGTRLFPLTKDRSKPAVPLAGKYRLVDIPISNCLNSNLRKIYVLTQFNSVSLHRHIQNSYQFDNFSNGFVDILAAQVTPDGANWYQGTADAVRQNLRYFLTQPCKYYIILSGDQLYRMDFRDLLEKHIRTGADMTIATTPVPRRTAPDFGIMHSDATRRIYRFVEKPTDPALLDDLKIPAPLLAELDFAPTDEYYQASMGIYVFNRQVLIDALNNNYKDFGKHIIPSLIDTLKVQAHIFKGYWEDIGTIRSFFEVNLELTDIVPPFNFFETSHPVYTHTRFLPGSKINSATIRNATIADGCIISEATLERCCIGIRSVINTGTVLREVIMMGADGYESPEMAAECPGEPLLGIGRNCTIRRAIIDKNARIGDNVVISPEGKPENFDGDNYYIRDGVVVIPKNGVIPAGTWI